MGMIGYFAEVTSAQLKVLEEDPGTIAAFIYSEGDSGPVAQLDLDKAWHGIHYLLTGDVWGGEGAEALAVLGGTPIGDDMGYGPVRYLTPTEVGSVSVALTAISKEKLHQRYLPSKLEAAGVYPSGIWEDEGEEAFEWLIPWYEQLAAFYKCAAKNGNAILLYIS